MSGTSFRSEEWEDLVAAFEQRLGSLGEVTVGEDELTFRTATHEAGLILRRDGTSQSFMPLHGLNAHWKSVVFDDAASEVRLEGDGLSYIYRVPPGPD